MTLAAGSKLGPYEILGQIGAGGMGEVYKARDLRLGREVALKVLPAELSDPESLRRFEQEARAASALNHPNIVVVYDVGRSDSVSYIAMELVEGKTIRELIAVQALPIRRILALATQIAEGLARAHAAGIVHRDLKPDNLMVTPDGVVKVLDFGLAKLVRAPDQRLTTAATEVLEATRTEKGTVLGTVGYMSPEQAAGREVDYRSDQFAFASIVYEMLTGRRAFQGASAAEAMAAIIREEPEPIASLRPDSPPPLGWMLERCLAKEPAERYESTRDLARDLATLRDRVSSAASTGLAAASPLRGPLGRRALWAVAAVAFVAALVLAVAHLRERPPPPRTIRFLLFPPEEGALTAGLVEFHDLAVSPDGNRIAFVASVEGQSRIWIRTLEAVSATPLAGTEDAASPFWSPDGSALGFFTGGKLKTIPAAGGPAQTICAVEGANDGAWGSGTILYTQHFSSKDGLYAVAASGGQPQQVTTESGYDRWPRFLPDGHRFLFLTDGKAGRFLAEGELGSPRIQRLAPFPSRFELSPGYLLYADEGVLLARAFDSSRLRFNGKAIPVAARIPCFSPTGWAPFSVSGDVVAYQARAADAALHWLNRKGETVGTVGPPGEYAKLRLSPDGKKVAVEKNDPATGLSDLWIADLSRDVMTRFTADPGSESSPVWSPDGSEIAFVSHGVSSPELRRKRLADSTGGETLVAQGFPWPSDWSRDGRFIALTNMGTKYDIWLLPLSGDRKPLPFRNTPFNDGAAAFSPDGRWVAFLSDESALPHVYVVSSSRSGQTLQVSSRPAATVPPLRWRGDGKELFYVAADNQLMSVPVRTESGRFESGVPVPLFRVESETAAAYDVSADGQRILTSSGKSLGEQPITVVVHWAAQGKP